MRLKLGHDVWVCDCGEAVLMGRYCSCGKSYSDKLIEAKTPERKKHEPKFRKPAEEREFTKSFLFRKGGKK